MLSRSTWEWNVWSPFVLTFFKFAKILWKVLTSKCGLLIAARSPTHVVYISEFKMFSKISPARNSQWLPEMTSYSQYLNRSGLLMFRFWAKKVSDGIIGNRLATLQAAWVNLSYSLWRKLTSKFMKASFLNSRCRIKESFSGYSISSWVKSSRSFLIPKVSRLFQTVLSLVFAECS